LYFSGKKTQKVLEEKKIHK